MRRGEGVRGVGEKEGVVIDIEWEREAVDEEDAGEEIEVGEECLPAPSGAALRAWRIRCEGRRRSN